MQNLPYSINEVRKIVNESRIRAEIKPRFHRPIESHLIKATQLMERLNIDFKGPLPSSKNKYLLTVEDEYSRFPLAFACSNIESQTVTNRLQQIFYLFGAPGYVHSDRGKKFFLMKLYRFCIVYAFPPANVLCTTLGRTVSAKNITILFGKVCSYL